MKKKGYIVGEPIGDNFIADRFYRVAMDKEIKKFITALIEDVEVNYTTIRMNNAVPQKKRALTPQNMIEMLLKYKGHKLEVFMRNSFKIIKKWLRLARNSTVEQTKRSLFKLAGRSFEIQYDKAFDDAMRIIVARNVSLIKNVADTTITNIENIVFDSMTTGQGLYEMKKGLYKQRELSQKRIKLIARDQTLKTNGALNEILQRKSGISYFQWQTREDKKVSKEHSKLNGKIFAWNEPENYPIIDSYGNKGLPKQRPLCRCRANPIIILKGHRAKQLPDGSYEVVNLTNDI